MNETNRCTPSVPSDADTVRKQPAALTILAPWEDRGDEPLFRVVYMIDLNAPCPEDAARHAYRIMSSPTSVPPVLEVIDHTGNTTTVDLWQDNGDESRPFGTKTVHPGIRQIHDLLYLDMQDGQQVYDESKQWDSDTMSMIAEIIGEYIPGPRQTRGTVPGSDPSSSQADPSCTRHWKCPNCGRTIDHSYEALAEVGIPICTDCDVYMEMI